MLIYPYILIILTLTTTTSISVSPTCQVCHAVVHTLQKSVPLQPSAKVFQQIAYLYCSRKKLQDSTVCKGAIKEMTSIILNSLWRHYTDPHSVCHQLFLCPKEYQIRNLTTEVNQILKGKPNKQWETPTKSKILKVLHISDPHIDLYYTVGAQAKCAEPVCCRMNVTKQKLSIAEQYAKLDKGQVRQSDSNVKAPAGFWGSLANCDLPLQTYQLFLEEIGKMELDLIIWTGDNTPHDIWQQTQDYNLNFTMILSQRLSRYTNATVVASMGNHESAPVNVYDFEGDREDVLKAGLANAWRKWLDAKAYEMLRTKGYYSITLPELNNLKVISMNCQVGNDQNWFLLRNPTDPGDMLKWIESELKQSESNNQFVYIIGHIPPQSSLNDWSMRFNALVDRYSYNIRGQFYGHTHEDQFEFFHSMTKKQQIVGFGLTAPSLETGPTNNPSYRILEIDFGTLQILNYHQYNLRLEKNPTKDVKPKFQHLYSFVENYQLSDMFITGGINQFSKKLQQNTQTQILYTSLKRGGLQKGYSGRNAYCQTMTSPQLITQCNGGTYKHSPFEKLAGNWKTLKHTQP